MATNNPSRMLVWIGGLAVILVGIVVLWQAAGLDRYLSTGILVAIVLVIFGIGVMAMANRYGFWGSRRVERVEEVGGRRRALPETGYGTDRVESRRVVEEEGEGRFAP